MPPSPVDFSGVESEEVKARSADGTMVPLSIIHKKGLARDGSNPTWLMGYGAYGISIDPFFQPTRLSWYERGGVLAVAHARGGGEYGEDWHRAGQKLTKQHTIDDFLACAQYLVEQKYTSPARLAGEGTSAGGVTIGGAITQRPDLFGAALIRVGDSDALRSELMESGPANIPEFGTVKDPDGFKALYAMAAYHHVKPGTAVPRRPVDDRRQRPARGALAGGQDGGAAAGGDHEREADPHARRLRRGPRHGLDEVAGRCGARGRGILPLLAARRAGVLAREVAAERYGEASHGRPVKSVFPSTKHRRLPKGSST